MFIETKYIPNDSYMRTITEDCIMSDLEIYQSKVDFEYNKIKNYTSDIFSSFFKFYRDGLGTIEIDDIVDDLSCALSSYFEGGNIFVSSMKFTISYKEKTISLLDQWHLIYTACCLYLGFDFNYSDFNIEYFG